MAFTWTKPIGKIMSGNDIFACKLKGPIGRVQTYYSRDFRAQDDLSFSNAQAPSANADDKR